MRNVAVNAGGKKELEPIFGINAVQGVDPIRLQDEGPSPLPNGRRWSWTASIYATTAGAIYRLNCTCQQTGVLRPSGESHCTRSPLGHNRPAVAGITLKSTMRIWSSGTVTAEGALIGVNLHRPRASDRNVCIGAGRSGAFMFLLMLS